MHVHTTYKLQTLTPSLLSFLAIEFKEKFLKEGGFPDAPSIPRDIPNDYYYTSTDQPGARGNDTNYEAAVREERAYDSRLLQLNNNQGYVSEDDSTYVLGHESYSFDEEDSDNGYSDVDGENLAFINTTLDERIDNPDNFLYDNSIPETAPEEAEMIPSPRQSRRAQDPIAKAVLDPIIFTFNVLDPEMLDFGQRIERVMVALRATLPSGYDASKIKVKVSPCGTKLLVTLIKMDANYDAAYVLGEDLARSGDGGAITSALASALAISYTANGCGDEEKVFVINLPFKVEARGRNPATGWKRCPPSFNGYLTVCSEVHSSFIFVYHVKEEDSRLEQPSVMGGGLINMTHQQQSSTLLPRHQHLSRMHVLDAFNNPPSPAFVTPPPPPTNTHIPQPFGTYPRALHRTSMDIDSTSSSGSFYEQTVPSTRPSATTTGASAVYDLQSSASLPPQVVYRSETPARSEFLRRPMNPASPQPEPIFRKGRRKKNHLSSNSSVASAASNNPRQKKYQAQAQMHQGTVEQQQQYEQARLAWEEEERRRMHQEEQQQQQQQHPHRQQQPQQHPKSAYNLRTRKPAPQGLSSSTAETAPPTVETVTSKQDDDL